MRPVKLAPGTSVVELSLHDALCLINALHSHADGMDNADAPLCDALAGALVGYALIAEGKDNFAEEEAGMRGFWAKWATRDTYSREPRKLAAPHWWEGIAVVWDNDPKEASE